MAKKIKPEALEIELKTILNKYSKDVQEDIKAVTTKLGEITAAKLKARSPKNTGEYASGWTPKKKSLRNGTSVVVYNATRASLTHLLEKGHATRNKASRVPAQVHIRPVEEEANKEYVKRLKEVISKR